MKPSALLLCWIVLAGSAVGGLGCVSARMSDKESDRLFREGRYGEAADHLKKGLDSQGPNGKDNLLYLLDIGLSLHAAGRYDESTKAFLQADKMAEIKDYTSIAAEGATLLVSDNTKDYKGEDFENVLINTYLAMNYALMGNWEDALVEARRVNHKLYMMVTQGKRKYKQNPFARYMSAILYEAQGNFNDAYVDYKNTHDLEPEFPGLGRDLWRCARVLGIEDDMDKWDKEYQLTDADHKLSKQLAESGRYNKAELIVLYENGISPVKRPNPAFREIPKFYPRPNPIQSAHVFVDGRDGGQTAVLDNIEATAIANLDEKYAGLIAKKLAGVVAKDAVAYGVARATNSRLLGALTQVALFAADQADVRSWNLLPRDLQILRILVEPGTHTIQVSPDGLGRTLPDRTIQVQAGGKAFVDFRYMP